MYFANKKKVSFKTATLPFDIIGRTEKQNKKQKQKAARFLKWMVKKKKLKINERKKKQARHYFNENEIGKKKKTA